MRSPRLLGVLAAVLLTVAAVAKDPRPNIVFILADDLGCGPVAVYGNPYYQTPHLDRLAREGLRFTTAYAAAPVCSPSRAALMTGQAPARIGLTDFIPGNPYPYARLEQPAWQKYLPLTATTLAERLTAGGYHTALIGKWHLAKAYLPPESVAEGPDRQGFAETWISHKPEPTHDPEADAHNVEAITRHALEFLDQPHDRPFFLYLTHNTIHAPIMAPRALVEKYRARAGSERPENNPVVAAMMEQFDAGVGRVLAKLDAMGLRENTLVIFYSDNGGLLADTAQRPFRGGKAQLYEGGIRVPLVMRWPGVIAAGTTCDVPVITMDFLPTLTEVAGIPPAAGEVRDGLSLLPLMRGEGRLARDTLYWHYPHYHTAGSGGPAGAIREGTWKMIEYFETSLTGTGHETELFDLQHDPGETLNLAKTQPARVAELHAKLAAWQRAVGAQLPGINPRHDAARADEKDDGQTNLH